MANLRTQRCLCSSVQLNSRFVLSHYGLLRSKDDLTAVIFKPSSVWSIAAESAGLFTVYHSALPSTAVFNVTKMKIVPRNETRRECKGGRCKTV